MSDDHYWYPPQDDRRPGAAPTGGGRTRADRDQLVRDRELELERDRERGRGGERDRGRGVDRGREPDRDREHERDRGVDRDRDQDRDRGRAQERRRGGVQTSAPGRPRRSAGQLPPPRRGGRSAAPYPGRSPADRRRTRQRRVLRWVVLSVCTVLVATLGVAAYVVQSLSADIRHQALLQPGETQAAEPVDSFGNSPMNILVIGSDTRDTTADCSIGGDCGAGANADVEMVVHLSADRSNATVVSIPRDTMVTMPSCVDSANNTATDGGTQAQITTSLQWGPSCTQKAVHELTGLTIDHYVVVDFSGVESLSAALGGVQVCVSNQMYDRDSGLRLTAGQNTVEGLSALQFVRTRHGFYDGSDLGREKAQHYFLAAMIREVRKNMNLSDAGTLLSVAKSATRALTVDDGLSGLTNLMSLATTMNKVPTDRISFVTMPWKLDPTNLNRVLEDQPSASQMFRNVRGDVPYSTGSGRPAAAAQAASAVQTPAAAPAADAALALPTGAPVDPAQVRVQVQNGSGITDRAATVADALTGQGFQLAQSAGNAPDAAASTVYYPADRADSAAAVAQALHLPAEDLQLSADYAEVTVVVGADWPSGGGYTAVAAPSGSAGSPSAGTAGAPPEASLENASASGGCVPVNPADVVR
ncbi:MAG TPA: LCP family protein [Actinocrinis sp.]|nr:LCP family protein [Actinocrinis sp.]